METGCRSTRTSDFVSTGRLLNFDTRTQRLLGDDRGRLFLKVLKRGCGLCSPSFLSFVLSPPVDIYLHVSPNVQYLGVDRNDFTSFTPSPTIGTQDGPFE